MDLIVGQTYALKSGNRFELIDEYHPNKECFKRLHDGELHLGREFIEFRHGQRIIDLELVK